MSRIQPSSVYVYAVRKVVHMRYNLNDENFLSLVDSPDLGYLGCLAELTAEGCAAHGDGM